MASGSETFALRNSLGLDLAHQSNMIYAYTSVVAKEGERTAVTSAFLRLTQQEVARWEQERKIL